MTDLDHSHHLYSDDHDVIAIIHERSGAGEDHHRKAA
jgi:hypothetical protein